MDRLEVEPAKGQKKSRAFSVALIGRVSANALWEMGRNGSCERPVLMMYAGTEQECRAFTANLRTGRRVIHRSEKGRQEAVIEIPKSSGMRWSSRKVAAGTVVTVYLPELWALDPITQDTETLRLLVAVPTWWVDAQEPRIRELLGGESDEAVREAAVAGLVAAHVDRRCPLPIVHDLGFHRQLYRAGVEAGAFRTVTSGRDFLAPKAKPWPMAGIETVISARVKQEEFAELLRQETATYYEDQIQPLPALPIEPEVLPMREIAEQLQLF